MSRLAFSALAGAVFALIGTSAQAVTLVGLTSASEIVRFDPLAPDAGTRTAITGLADGERLVGIDTRPSDGKIYGVSTAQKIYTVDEMTGMASFVNMLSAPVINSSRGYGIDFNPVADYNGATSLRLVSTTGDNFAINVSTGVVGNTGSNIGAGYSAVAYTNSALMMPPAPASTALYYIDTATDMLRMTPTGFNAPTIVDVGALGIDVLKANGFEVLANGMAYAALTMDDVSLATGIFGIHLATGAATLLASYDGTLSGLTVSAVPEPATTALLLAGLGVVAMRARRRTA
ncbi:MAG: DUF4394 domain-containing protein [Rubrivivax sp.]|nr:DUF4394 domain-containing protein [Rubrivivax sp.]